MVGEAMIVTTTRMTIPGSVLGGRNGSISGGRSGGSVSNVTTGGIVLPKAMGATTKFSH
jgi:hypothetical protein